MTKNIGVRGWSNAVAAAALTVLLVAPAGATAGEVAVWDAGSSSGLKVEPISVGTYRRIQVNVTNSGTSEKTVTFAYGAYFDAADDRYQDLSVVFPEDLRVGPGETKSITLRTTCMDASKGVTSSGYAQWTPKRDAALGDILRFYDVNRPLVEQATGRSNHDTIEKRHNFLQLLVWTYYGSDKAHMKRFATQYMFDGDSQAAGNFVDTFYPAAKTALDMYKAGNKGGFSLPF